MEIKLGDSTFRMVYPNPDKYWYLCTPYSKYPLGREQAYLDAAKMSMYLMENGIHVFSPIVHSHTANKFVTKKELDNSHDFWLMVDKKFIDTSRGLIVCMMKGWTESYGINWEINYAKDKGMLVYYTDFMELPKGL